VGTVISSIRREGIKFSELCTSKGLAVLAFCCLLFVFVLNTRLCPDDVATPQIAAI
jgi:hypothetical protein